MNVAIKEMKQLIYLALPLLILVAAGFVGCDKTPGKVAVTEDEAEIKFDTLSHDYGNVLLDTVTSYDFVFHNIGATPLYLESVVPGCGCTSVKWTHGGIDPGESGVITAIYNSHGRRPGHFKKSIRVYSNAKTRFLRLSISGDMVDADDKADDEQ